MMNDRSLWGWAQYTAGGVWHAYHDDRSTWCGRIEMMTPRPASSPAGPRCLTCVARLRREGMEPRRVRHQDRAPCGCDMCRDRRRTHAADFAHDTLTALPACGCVQRWDGAGAFVDGPFARFAGLLLAWEMMGDGAGARDVETAALDLRAAWRNAADRYDVLGGLHPHEIHETRS